MGKGGRGKGGYPWWERPGLSDYSPALSHWEPIEWSSCNDSHLAM